MITTTNDKREFAQILREVGDLQMLYAIQEISKEFWDGDMPADVSICYLNRGLKNERRRMDEDKRRGV